jgi:hypothetical protein
MQVADPQALQIQEDLAVDTLALADAPEPEQPVVVGIGLGRDHQYDRPPLEHGTPQAEEHVAAGGGQSFHVESVVLPRDPQKPAEMAVVTERVREQVAAAAAGEPSGTLRDEAG